MQAWDVGMHLVRLTWLDRGVDRPRGRARSLRMFNVRGTTKQNPDTRERYDGSVGRRAS